MYFIRFGEILRGLRENKGLTQSELGELTGTNKAVISKYENAMSYPPYDTLIRIAQTFRVSSDYLLGMEKTKILDTEGLTDSQILSLEAVIEQYRILNVNLQNLR